MRKPQCLCGFSQHSVRPTPRRGKTQETPCFASGFATKRSRKRRRAVMRKRQYKEKRPKQLRLGAMAERQTESTPSFTRILFRHGLCSADLSAREAFDLFTRVGADHIVKANRPKSTVPRTNILGIYANTAAALDRLSALEKTDLLERLAKQYRLSA